MHLIDRIRRSEGAATDSLLLTSVQVVTTVLGLIVTKLLSVHFSLQEYGTYSQALLVTTTVTSISILGLTNATSYFYNRSEDAEERRDYIATIFTIQYIVGALCAVLLCIFRMPIARCFGNTFLAILIPIVAFTPLLNNLIAMYQTLFVSIGKAKVIVVRNLVVSVARLFAVVLACYVFRNIYTILIVILILDITQTIYYFYLFSKYRGPILIRNSRIELFHEILSFSIPMSIYVLTNSLSRDIDKYVVSAFANTEALAIYTNAARILPFDMLTSSLITVLVPIITRMINQARFSEAATVFKLYLRIGYVLTFIFAGGAVAVAPDLMRFLYSEQYLVGLPVFVIYLFIDMIRFANVTTILSGAGKTKTLMLISLVTLLCNAGFNVVGFHLFGIVGPAVITFILTLCMTAALVHFGAKEIHSNVFSLFNIKEMLLVGTEILVMGIFVHMLSNVLSRLGLSYVFRLVICYSTFLCVVLSLNYRRAIECYRALNGYRNH